MFGRQPTDAGIDVDEDTALNFAAVWCAVSLLSSSAALLPAVVCKVKDDTHTRDTAHPAHGLLSEQPNPEMTPFVWRETMLSHALTWGNGYNKIDRDGDIVTALWPIMPNQLEPDRSKSGRLFYRFTARYPGEKDAEYKPEDVLHVPGLGFDGLRGFSVVQRARDSIGFGMAAERHGASLYGRGANPGGVLEHPGTLGPEGIKNLRETWEQLHRGPENAHRVAVLEEGMTWKPTGIPPEDAQYLQTRQFQIVEIARWFNVPPHMLKDLTYATYSNIEYQQIEFLMYSLLPWLERMRQEFRRKLFSDQERSGYIIDFDVTRLLQADMKTRFEAYASARNGGWYSLNDILRRENMNPLPPQIGDTHLQPTTMKIAGAADASTPIDPAVMQAAYAFAKGLMPCSSELLTETLKAAMPSANDDFIGRLVGKLQTEKTDDGKPNPTPGEGGSTGE